jgi:PleD family two-component response regulator/EAL domain-containing protein (putative c-di-GMP-specific phosphodiesterase class I)
MVRNAVVQAQRVEMDTPSSIGHLKLAKGRRDFNCNPDKCELRNVAMRRIMEINQRATLAKVLKDMQPHTHAALTGRVLYLGADQGAMTDLAQVLDAKGIELVFFSNPTDVAAACADSRPAVLILDLNLVSATSGLESFLGGLFAASQPCPGVICLEREGARGDTVARRLEVMRAGANSYVTTPVSSGRLANRIFRMCGVVDDNRYRILIAESDQAEARSITSLLVNAGMEALVVEDPLKLLDAMQVFRPNLVLMELVLPGVTGAELAAIIRDHDDFFGIPILFLSAESNLDKQLEALKAGGDGFITKPVRRNQLIGAVEHRMRMSRWLQDRRALLNRRETATGFLPRDVFLRHLERITRAGGAQDDGCGVLVIELDAYQPMHESLGLGGAEKLLRQLETQLANCMTPEEIATRLDDDRYALFAKRESAQQLRELAERLCRLLAAVKPKGVSYDVQTTVSIGIGLFTPPADGAITMVSRGQKAAAGAKQAGGNQVDVWIPAVVSNGAVEADVVLKRLVSAALAQDGLFLLFQPLMSLDRKDDELYEALLRLRTMDGEQIPPMDFLPIAERDGLISRIDRWVLGRALETMDRQRSAHPGLRLMVHQSIATLAAPDWLPWFRDKIIQHKLTKLYPVLQFRLEDVHRNKSDAKPIIGRLRTYGIQACVANVSGTKEEAAMLARLGVSLAKLSFQTINSTEQGQLAEAIERLRQQGIAVIAAGIDDPATVARVWNCRPDFIQGNYLRMPSADLGFDFQRVRDAV